MRVFLIFFFLIFTASVFSIDLFDSPMDEDNKRQIDTVFSEISSHQLVKSEFSQGKTIKRINKTIESSGYMIFDSAEGIAWQILKPFSSITVLTDNAMIQKSPGGQVRIMNGSGNETFHRFSKTIQSVFLGQIDLILEEYKLFYLEEETDLWKIGLIPKDSALQNIVKAFEIHGTDFIEIFRIYEANGDNILYEFQNISFPDKLSQDDINVFH